MTGRSWNGTRPENGTSPESGGQPAGGGQPQGSLLVREGEQVSPPAEEVGLGSGPAGAGAESLASGAPQPDELPPSEPLAQKPLWRRLVDRARHVFGSSHFVDDMLECAPVGTYAAMADEVLGPQQSGSAAGSRDMHPSR